MDNSISFYVLWIYHTGYACAIMNLGQFRRKLLIPYLSKNDSILGQTRCSTVNFLFICLHVVNLFPSIIHGNLNCGTFLIMNTSLGVKCPFSYLHKPCWLPFFHFNLTYTSVYFISMLLPEQHLNRIIQVICSNVALIFHLGECSGSLP